MQAAASGCGDFSPPHLTSPHLTSPKFGTLVCRKSSGLEFKTTSEGRFLAAATLQNTGGGVVRILSVTPSCGCTSVALGQVTLHPGEEGFLTFEIDPRVANSMAMRFDYAAGKVWLEAGFKVKGDFDCSGGQHELSLRCGGAYQLPVTLPPGASDLGETSTSSDAGSFIRTVLVNPKTPVTAITVQNRPPVSL
ncbi:MAG: DUF1573 domain-containing protein [Planctomycetaceae bacterium]